MTRPEQYDKHDAEEEKEYLQTVPENTLSAMNQLEKLCNPCATVELANANRESIKAEESDSGGAGEIRTPDTQFRKLLLYPSELQPRPIHCNTSFHTASGAPPSCS